MLAFCLAGYCVDIAKAMLEGGFRLFRKSSFVFQRDGLVLSKEKENLGSWYSDSRY